MADAEKSVIAVHLNVEEWRAIRSLLKPHAEIDLVRRLLVRLEMAEDQIKAHGLLVNNVVLSSPPEFNEAGEC